MPAEPRSPYAILAAHFTESPSHQLLRELTRELSETTGAGEVHVWRAHPDGFHAESSWPPSADRFGDVIDISTLDTLAGLRACALITDDAGLLGTVTIIGPGQPAISRPDRDRLERTADCVLLLWRRDALKVAVRQQEGHTSRLAGELADSRRRLSTVRELERRRVAAQTLALGTSRFELLHQQVKQLDGVLTAGGRPDSYRVDELRALVDELIHDFRVMVRGIHPQVSQTRGPRAALAEVIAGLPRPARITGTIPARVDVELGASLYHLIAVALQVLTDSDRQQPPADPASPLDLHLSHRGELLAIRMTIRSRISATSLRAGLAVDADRLAALGGGVAIGIEDELVSLHAWVPDRLEPAALAPAGPPAALPARVRALTLALVAGYGDGAGSGRAQALVGRLEGPVRLGVAGIAPAGRRHEQLRAIARKLPEVALSTYPPPESPGEVPDAVLRPDPAAPDQRLELLLPQVGVLRHSIAWDDLPAALATELVARSDLLRARSVLAALIVLLREAPLIDPTGQRFHYELEELRSGTHQVAELETIARLRTGALLLTPAQSRAAVRLLGGAGEAANERLGLTFTTSVAERAAAVEALRFWRRAEAAAAGRREREVCGVVVRSCERLLADLSPS